MKIMNRVKSFWPVPLLIALVLFRATSATAQAPPFPPLDPYYLLDSWSFNDTNWFSDLGDAPLSFTNLNNLPSFDGSALQVDSANAARLQYNIVDDVATNLTFDEGTIEFWVLPDWNSGTGPGDWGRLIDVGAYSTNTPSSWWSLYFSSDGNSLCFSSETNGIFTNYLSFPISWDTNTWHMIDLTYMPRRSRLYIDGQLATNGSGSDYIPDAETVSNGFFVGSDITGWQQSRSLIDDLATYNYAFSPDEVSNDYVAATGATSVGGGFSSDGDAPLPPSGGTNGDGGIEYFNPPAQNYGSNLWVAVIGATNNILYLLVTNSQPDILYELQGCTNLASPVWASYGFVYGSELTNCELMTLPMNQNDLFLRIRSWQDDTGTGIPDWWWYMYFGQITNVNAYASAAGDGFSNLQKWQMGLNPTNYYNPNPPTNFVPYLAGSNVFLYWSPSPGPVVNYAIQRGVYNTNTGVYNFTQFLVSSNATNFEDVGAVTNSNTGLNLYQLYAIYPGSSFSGTNTWYVSWGNYLLPSPTNLYAFPDITGTNVLLAWTAAPSNSLITGYIIERGTYGSSGYTFITNSIVSNNVTSFEDFGILTNATNWSDVYQVAAVYPGGGLSSYVQSFYNYQYPIQVGYGGGSAGPTNFYGYATYVEYPYLNTNVYLKWTATSGAVSNYVIYASSNRGPNDYQLFHQLAKVSSNTTSYTVPGGIDFAGNLQYSTYALVAVYTNGSQSQGVFWDWLGGNPGPTSFEAYVDSTGSNILLNWSAVSNATGYLLQESYYGGSDYFPIATNNTGTLTYTDIYTVELLTNYDIDPSNASYQVQAIFPDGNYSASATAQVTDTPPPPSYPPATNLTATIDLTGTNVLLNWTAAPGSVSSYIIKRGTFSPQTETYTYTQIGTTTGTSYEDYGAIAIPNDYNVSYEVIANYGGGILSRVDSYTLDFSDTPPPTSNISIGAQLVRNQTGRWQLMFSDIPTNVDTVALFWFEWDYSYDFGGPFWFTDEIDLPANTLTNGTYVIPDWLTTNYIGDVFGGLYALVQPIKGNDYGNPSFAGFLPFDQASFVDGRIPLKQNLIFEILGSTISQPVGLAEYDFYFAGSFPIGIGIPTDTNYVESSIFHWEEVWKAYNSDSAIFTEMDDLWPYQNNYQLHTTLYDTNYSGPAYFVWQTNLNAIPAPPVLGISDPYWISQNFANLPAVGAYSNSGTLYFQSGQHNLFGLPFETALVNKGGVTATINPATGLPVYTTNPPVYLAPGASTAYTNANCWFSQTTQPDLVLSNYYFAPVVTPGTELPSENTPLQLAPIPALAGFDNTNQTQIMITSLGTPTVIGGWARFAITNGNPTKFAYLGQYFETNAFVVTNGVVTTNTEGVVSPYGDFFPRQPGEFAMVTMPDIDTMQQGTGVVDVISLNVDANHDGTMDLSYSGPDFVSQGNPFRFWSANDDNCGDYGGDGIPGYKQPGEQDGNLININGSHVQGRRHLEDFFPVYINIGGIFQSNAWRAGINPLDSSWRFVLSQSDAVLRFFYTHRTPTNYMSVLQDTNVSGNDASADLYQIYGDGSLNIQGPDAIYPRGAVLVPWFLDDIATNNGGIIFVEAATNTTAPLVLTIYHGTNQIARTQLPLSITSIEQMFRSETILLNSDPRAVTNRLTDADVPNELPTNDKNLVFLHGYNVNPLQARGEAADMFKRMYWSGSHAKFWAVTWEGYDSQDITYGLIACDYHENVNNAFLISSNLTTFLRSIPGGNINVVAHSLGNMVVLSALNDYNAPISNYFMVDAAVALEAVDGNDESLNLNMVDSPWTTPEFYTNRLYASYWWTLFPTNDARSTLTWSNRLANFHNTTVYNFYSSGEEVLREYDFDPPLSGFGVETALLNYWSVHPPFASYIWAWQDKGKGVGPIDTILGSTHGGWKFNTNAPYYYTTNGVLTHMANSVASVLPASELQTNAFFDTSYDYLLFTQVAGSLYAQESRDRILSDAIPAISLPVGANPVPKLGAANFDMQTLFENSWPPGRGTPLWPSGTSAFGEWHHGDFHQVAYTFTYPVFSQIVNLGNLK